MQRNRRVPLDPVRRRHIQSLGLSDTLPGFRTNSVSEPSITSNDKTYKASGNTANWDPSLSLATLTSRSIFSSVASRSYLTVEHCITEALIQFDMLKRSADGDVQCL
jgi:hypothetical protein